MGEPPYRAELVAHWVLTAKLILPAGRGLIDLACLEDTDRVGVLYVVALW